MTTTPDPSTEHDQDAEPPTPDGEEVDYVDPDDTTPGSDPDPDPGAEAQ
jgi:hypothetical protein